VISYVQADRQRFKQVLLNLLTNAVKYTPAKGKVTVSYSGGPDKTVRVTVTDTGPGIPKEKLSRLFIPFERLGAEQSSIEGTGLGLALCQQLVTAMHGSIGVESNVGQGSTFWLELARAESPLARLEPRKSLIASLRSPNANNEKQTVLYIEDNLSN